MDKISFIIPTHNAENTLEQTVESVRRLDVDYEILLVENGSTDRTGRLVSGLPVIIWKEAAEAGFVEENKVGLTVQNVNFRWR